MLTGTLPASWSQLPVQEVVLKNNAIRGSLPPSWGSNTSKLVLLSLSGNILSGKASFHPYGMVTTIIPTPCFYIGNARL